MNKKSFVSILICSYNADRFIESTVQSILEQTYEHFELLILDNASSDKTVEILHNIEKKDKRLIVFVSKTNHGAYPGLNYLLEKAKGNYIAINDHDDIWHPDKLKKQIEYLESHPDSVGCGTAILNWYEQYHKGILRAQPAEHTVAWHTSLVYRNDGYRYDVSHTVGTDFYFMYNILCTGGKTIHNLSEPYVFRRIWSGQKNLSSNWMKKMQLLQILKLSIPIVDKIVLLFRKFIPATYIEWLIIHVFQKKDSFSPSEVKEHIILRAFSEQVL